MKINIKYFYFVTFLIFYSCKSDEYKGIKIGTVMDAKPTENETELKEIIDEILEKKPIGLKRIIKVDCNNAGCYDLGFVLTQTLRKIGENNFIKMCETLNYYEKQEIKSLLEVGFEYGDNNYDGKMDDSTLSKKYPELSEKLYEK